MEVDPRPVVTGALVAGLLAGYGIAMPVGPVGTYLVALTARTSLRVGACAALGVASADGFYAVVAVVAGSALAPLLAPIVAPLQWASALVLVGLAVTGGATAVRRYRAHRSAGLHQQTPVGALKAYLGMLGMTLLSPMTVIYFAALVLGGGSGATKVAESTLFVVAAFVASASWQLLLAGGGALLGQALTGRIGRLMTALASSVVIVVLAVRLVS